MVGLFVSTVVLRTDLSGEPTFRALLQRAHGDVLEALEHQQYPFDKVVDLVRPERSLSHSPLFQAAFALQNTPATRPFETFGGGAHFELSLHMADTGGDIRGVWEYNSDLFDATTIERMTGHFARLVEEITENPDRRISELPMLGAAERAQLLDDWNATTTEYPRDATVIALFEAQVRATPDAIALVIPATTGTPQTRQVTYAELDRRANELAERLASMGVRAGSFVATMLDRSEAYVVSVLATLKLGGVYVPVDPASPRERGAQMFADADVSVVLTTQAGRDRLPDTGARIALVDEPSAPGASAPGVAAPRAPRAPGVTARDPAYVMFTSGSTGRPKAIEVPHRAIVRLVRNTNYVSLSEREVILACAPVSFDASTFELWGSLLNGGRLIIYPGAIPHPDELAELVGAWGVTTMWLTAGLFHLMVETRPEALTGVRQLLAGGDVLSPTHARRALEALEGGVLINGYGPTENTTFTCCHVMASDADVDSPVPIGRPVANTRVYVLDAAMQPVPIGVRGELWAGGDGVAIGYRNDPDLTKDRFRADPFSSDPSARLYGTGDLARYRPNGVIEFLGRRDHQVKIRGFRIELGEIEQALHEHGAVADALVVARERSLGDKRLVAFVVPAAGHQVDPVALRAHLAARLPDYAVPSAIIPLDAFPLTPNGKVDTARLVEPTEERGAGERPHTALETQLLMVWEEVLGIDGIGIRDNFFDLGGNSLLGVRLLARLGKVLGRRIPVSVLFQGQTIESMAVALQQDLNALSFCAVTIQPGTNLAPLFVVPGVDGNVIGYETLARSLGTDLPVYGLRSVGLDGEAEPRESAEAIADAFLPEILKVQPNGPYRVAGLCMGGIVAFELAHRLLDRGENVQLLALIDTYPPGAIPTVPRASRVAQQILFLKEGVTRHIRALGERPPREWPGYLWRRLAIVTEMIAKHDVFRGDRLEFHRALVRQANHRAAAQYDPRPYPGRLAMILTSRQAVTPQEDARFWWERLALGGSTVTRVPGPDSGALLRPPFVSGLAEALRRAPGRRKVRSTRRAMNLVRFLLRAGGKGAIVVAVAGVLSGLASTGFIAVVNLALQHGERRLLLAAFAAVALARIVTNLLAQWFMLRFSQESVFNLSDQLCRQIIRTPFRTLEKISPARITSTLTDDIGVLSAALQTVPNVVTNAAILVGCFTYLAVLSVPAAFGLAICGVLGAFGYKLLMQRAAGSIVQARLGRDQLFGHFRTLTEGIKELKMNRARSRQLLDRDIHGTISRLRDVNLAASREYLVADGWTQAVFFIIIGLVLFALPTVGHVAAASVTSYAFVALYAMTPIWVIISTLPTFQRGQTALDRIEGIGLALTSASAEAPAEPPSAPHGAAVELTDVVFAYEPEGAGRGGFTLGPVDLTVQPGELVFLIGGNGSGKSTFVKLFTGLYAPDSGVVKLNGERVDDAARERYREHFSVVFSDFFLFGSVAGLTDEHLDQKASAYLRLLDLHHKVTVADGVLSTTALSQGQRRRLALMAAYLEDRPVYVFDEWAADQDPGYRQVFYAKLLPELKARGKTVVVITHDDRYFHLGDRVIKLDYGRIVDSWCPSERAQPGEAALSGAMRN